MVSVADWIVEPFEALGPLLLGASRSEVRSVLAEEPREFQKRLAPGVVEGYDTAGVHAYYDGDGRLEFLEAFDPCRPVYVGVPLLGSDAATIVARMRNLEIIGRDDGGRSIWFDDHGFALYALHEASEGVSVFRRGYDTGLSVLSEFRSTEGVPLRTLHLRTPRGDGVDAVHPIVQSFHPASVDTDAAGRNRLCGENWHQDRSAANLQPRQV